PHPPSPRRTAGRRARLDPVLDRHHRAGLHRHRGAHLGMAQCTHRRRFRRFGHRARRLRAVGAAHPASDAGRIGVRQPAVLRRKPGGHGGVSFPFLVPLPVLPPLPNHLKVHPTLDPRAPPFPPPLPPPRPPPPGPPPP